MVGRAHQTLQIFGSQARAFGVHAIHLVHHVRGQKFACGNVQRPAADARQALGPAQRVIAHAQLLLGGVNLRDVARDAQQAYDPALLVQVLAFDGLEDMFLSIHNGIGQRDHRLRAGQCLGIIVGKAVLAAQQLFVRLADGAAFRHAGHLVRCGVGEHITPLQVFDEDDV